MDQITSYDININRSAGYPSNSTIGVTISHSLLDTLGKEFDGDITLVVFPFLQISNKGAEETAKEIGNYLQVNVKEVCSYNVVKGFLNLIIDDTYWMTQFILASLLSERYPHKTEIYLSE